MIKHLSNKEIQCRKQDRRGHEPGINKAVDQQHLPVQVQQDLRIFYKSYHFYGELEIKQGVEYHYEADKGTSSTDDHNTSEKIDIGDLNTNFGELEIDVGIEYQQNGYRRAPRRAPSHVS